VRDQGLATVLKGVKSNDPADFDTAEQNYAISSQIRKARSYRERCKALMMQRLRALKRLWKMRKAVELHSLRPKPCNRHQTAPRALAGCND
jgi:hypothetical protein